jgi:hypothetical protein
MDDRLEKGLSHANYALTVSRQKKNFKERYSVSLQHSINGGTFLATPNLISFVDLLIRQGNEESVLVDENENPIEIADLVKFLENLMFAYHGATNEFFSNYEKLRKSRTVKGLVGL